MASLGLVKSLTEMVKGCLRMAKVEIFVVQWGSQYRTSLVFKWSKVVQLPNGPLFESHLNTGLNLVCYSNGGLNTRLPFEYRTSEYRTSESSFYRCFHYSDVCYSDLNCIRLKF